MTTPNSEEIKSYQALLRREESLYRRHGESLSPSETYLDDEALSECLQDGVSPADLLEDGMLLEFAPGYRTTHFDLLHRLSNIRNGYDQDPLVFESDISIETEKVPDFGAMDLREVLDGAELDDEKAELIVHAIEGGDSTIDGLSSHQAKAIDEVLSPTNDCLTLDGPTASGKSLTFSIPSFKHALDALGREGIQTSSLLLYPRQALIRDQLSTLLPRLDRLNDKLEETNKPTISLGIDHGETPKEVREMDEESFFGITCPRCEQHDNANDLIIESVGGTPQVRCPACDETLDYIIPTKTAIAQDPPTILLSTIWTVYHRLRSSRGNNATRYDDLEYVVLDEAHIYTSYVGGHVQYILQLLKDAKAGDEIPQFVLSSATLSNPVEFTRNLTTLDREAVIHVDYEDVLANAGVDDERHLVHYYVLPPPNRSVETLNEAMVQCLNLWCARRGFRALNFIDSIAEINRQYSYIANYILSPSGNRGEEVVRHTHPDGDISDQDPFSWKPLLPRDWVDSSRSDFQNYVMSDFANSIGTHSGELLDRERNRIEDSFNAEDGGKRLLLSTSTLEMGVDLNSVAAVLQYKLPPGKNEGVIQRIGRAGRNPDTYRVGLGIIEFSSKPSSMMYMFDEELRDELESTSNLSPSQIGNSASIQVQHVLSRALHRMAREGYNTYADGRDGIQTRAELIDFLRELINYVENTELPHSFVDPESTRRDTFERQKQEFLAQLQTVVSGYESTDEALDIDPEGILTKSQRYYRELRQIRRKLESVRRDLAALPDIPEEYMEPIEETADSLRTLTHLVNDLEETVRHAWYTRDPDHLRQWVEENENDLRDAIDRIPERSEMHDLLFMELMVWVSGEYGSTSELEEKYDLHMEEITDKLTNAVQRFEPNREDNFKSEIESLLDQVRTLQEQNLEVLASTHVLSRFEELVVEYQRAEGAHLFPVLNTILQNSIHFTGTFEAPQPEFDMEETTA